MNRNRSSLFWGFLLIAGGVFFLARQLGYVDESTSETTMLIFGCISLVRLVMYFASTLREWC